MEVTPGALNTKEGLLHVLYYKVHRRCRLDRDLSDDDPRPTRETSLPGKHPTGLMALFLHKGLGAECFPNHIQLCILPRALQGSCAAGPAHAQAGHAVGQGREQHFGAPDRQRQKDWGKRA